MSCELCEGRKSIGALICDAGMDPSLTVDRVLVLKGGEPHHNEAYLVLNDADRVHGKASFEVNYCPVCGRDLREVDE